MKRWGFKNCGWGTELRIGKFAWAKTTLCKTSCLQIRCKAYTRSLCRDSLVGSVRVESLPGSYGLKFFINGMARPAGQGAYDRWGSSGKHQMTYMGDISNTTAAQQRLIAARMTVCLQAALQTNETPIKLHERRSVKRARESDSHLWKMLEEENQRVMSFDPSSNFTRNLRVRVPVSLGSMEDFLQLPAQPNSQLLLLVNDADGKQIQVQLVAVVCAWSGMCLHLASVPCASAADGVDDAIRQSFQRARSAAVQLGVTAETVTDDVPVLKTNRSDGSCSWPGAAVFWAALREHGGHASQEAGGSALASSAYRWPRPAMLQAFMTEWNTSPHSLSAVVAATLKVPTPLPGTAEWKASLSTAAGSAAMTGTADPLPVNATPQFLWVSGVLAAGAAAPPNIPLGGPCLLPAALQPCQPAAMVFPVAPESRSLSFVRHTTDSDAVDDVTLDARSRIGSCSDIGVPGVAPPCLYSFNTGAPSSGSSSPWFNQPLANPVTPGALSPVVWAATSLAPEDDDHAFA